MDCFIKRLFEGKPGTHDYFVRFGKGRFESKALLNLQKTSKIKLKGSFEWANDFVKTAAELMDINFSGIILSKQELSGFEGKKKREIFEYVVENISSGKIKEIQDKVYFTLLDGQGEEIILKIKKKLPKPGKSGEGKVDDKFCQLEIDLKYWQQIKDSFMLPECRKCKISHIYNITELILPEGEKDFAKMREFAGRKGTIIRKTEIDGQVREEEKEFEA